MKQTRFGILSRVALLVVGIELVAFSLLGWLSIDHFSREIEQRALASIHRVGEMLAADELPISTLERKRLLSDLIGEPYVDGMAIGGSGRVIVSTRPDYLGRKAIEIEALDPQWLTITEKETKFIAGENTLTAVQEIYSPGSAQLLYHVIITISTAKMAAKKQDFVLRAVTVSLLFMLLSSLAIVYSARRLVTRRVNASLATLEHVEKGKLDERIPVTSNDELGRLQQGVNSMISEVAELLVDSRNSAIELKKQKDLLQSIIQNAPLGVFWKDRQSRYVGCNSRFAKDAGFAFPDEVIGKTDAEMVWSDRAEQFRADDVEVMESTTPRLDYELMIQNAEGKELWLSSSKVPLRDKDGEIIGVLGIYSDITEKKKANDEIRNLAYYDSLTGLPNRRMLMERLGNAIAVSDRNNKYAALLMLDLDNFKDLNESLGHEVGDRLLREVAKRVLGTVREVDSVARFGGDEFVIILQSLGDEEETAANRALQIAEKIRTAIDQKFTFDGSSFSHYTTPSIGVTLFRGKGNAVDDLLRQVDVALYQAKKAGRNAIRFFNPKMQTRIDQRLHRVAGLRRALDDGELSLHFQPQVDWKYRVYGAEALLRWQPVQGPAVSPAEFIPLAEESGLIIPLGDWVLGEACKQIKRWEADPSTRDLELAVNVSSHQFRQNDFAEHIGEQIKRYAIRPERLKLELTESVVLSDVDEVIERMNQIRSLGVGFAMDDFGTGFSSLSYLKRLPFSQIKIDRSFVQDITSVQSDAEIVRAILAMSDSLGIPVIAEGVETSEQYDFLRQYGCHFFQGYYFGKPVRIEEWGASVASIQSRFHA